jgi:ABC-2 type transport system ATP-binding protein
MQQKVAVAAALITDPPILLLDEPTIGLDVQAARTVKDWIAQLARDQGKTILLTTHQLPIAQELAGRIAVLRDGRIIADLPTPELLSRYAEDRFEVRTARMQHELGGGLPPGTRIEPGQGATRILLPDTDQAVLHKVLEGLRAANIPLLSVSRAQPGLEEVFLRLIRPGEGDGRAAATAADGERVA